MRKIACKIQAPEKTNLDMVRNPDSNIHPASHPPCKVKKQMTFVLLGT